MNVYQQWSERAPIYDPLPETERTSGIRRNSILDSLDRQMAGFVAQHKAAVNGLRKCYVFSGDASVRDFLNDHPAILQILREAAPKLLSFFGSSTVFLLRTPIDEAGSRSLYAVILWTGSVQDVRAKLARFDNDWWMARAQQARGSLTFTYELV